METKPSETAQTLFELSNSYEPKCSLELSGYGQPFIIPVSPAEIQTPTQLNLIGRSTTASPPMPSPSNILPPLLLIAAFMSARKNSAHLSKRNFSFFFVSVFKRRRSLKPRDFKWRTSGSVCVSFLLMLADELLCELSARSSPPSPLQSRMKN